MNEQIIIEIIADSSQLLPTIDILQKLGKLTQAEADNYKKVAAESAKAFQVVNDNGKKLLPTLGAIEKNVSNLSNTFIQEFQKQVQSSLLKSTANLQSFIKELQDVGDQTPLNRLQQQLAATLIKSNQLATSLDELKNNRADIINPDAFSLMQSEFNSTLKQIKVLKADIENLKATDVEIPVTLKVNGDDVAKAKVDPITVPIDVSAENVSAVISNIKKQLDSSNFDFDLLSNAISQASALLPLLDKDSAAYKTLSDYINQANTSLDKILSQSQGISKLAGQLQAALSSKLGDIDFGSINFANVKEAGKELGSVGDDARKLTAILKVTQTALNSLDPNTSDFKTLSSLFESGNITIGQYNQSLKQLAAAEENAGKSEATFRTQIFQSTNALAEQIKTGRLTTAEIYDLAKAGGELKNSYSNAQQAITALSSNTFAFDAIAQGVQGATGAVQIFAGASALAGNENEDFQKTIIKLNSLLNISAGVQQTLNALQKESAFVLGAQLVIEKTLNFVRTGSFQTTKQIAAATQVDVVAKEANTIATTELTVATTASSIAMQVFRVALLATGIGAVVVLVGALVSAFSDFASKADDAAESEKNLNDTIEKTTESIQAQIDFINKSGSASADRIKTELDLAEKRGASEKELFTIREKLYNQELTTAKQAQDAAIKRAEKEDVNVSNSIKGYAALQNAAYNYFTDQDALENQRQNNLADLNAAQEKNDKDDIKNAQDKLAATESSLAASKTAYQLYNGVIKQVSDSEISIQELTAEKSKYYNDLKTKNAEANAQALLNITQRALQADADFYKKISQDPSFGSQIQLDALQKNYDAQKAMLENEKSFELQKEGLTALQRTDIIDKFQKEEIKLTDSLYKSRKDIVTAANAKQVADDQAYYNQLISQHKQYIDKLNAEVDDQFQKISDTNQADQLETLGRLESEYKNGAITLEQFLQKRETLNKKYDRMDLDNQIASLEAKISNDKAAGENVDALQRQLNEKLKQRYNENADNNKTSNDEILANQKNTLQQLEAAFDFINQSLQVAIGETGNAIFTAFEGLYDALQRIKVDDTLKGKAKDMAILGAATEAVQLTVNALFQQTSQQRQALAQAEIDKLDKLRQKELDNKILTESQKDAINKKYDRQEAAVKTKAAQAQKQADISQAVTNGALAIIKTFASVPWPLNLVISGVIAALTARQVGIIQSTPIPQFRKGTKYAPAGYAIVGEEGPEIVKLRGGEKIYTHSESKTLEKHWNKQTIRESYKQPVVYNDYWLLHPETATVPTAVPSPFTAIAALIPQPVDKEIIEKSYKQTQHSAIDYDKLGDKIGAYVAQHMGKVVKDLPQTGFNWDEDGVKEWIRKGNQTDIILNKKGRITKK